MPLFSLAYVSTSTRPMTDGDLLDILREARSFNEAHGITGMLTYFGDTFVQMLEGEQENVLGVLKRIRQDKRHHSIVVTQTREIGARVFSGWSMAFVKAERFAEFAGVSQTLDPSLVAEVLLADANRTEALQRLLHAENDLPGASA